MTNDENYVGISNPIEIRRNILETSKEVISNLRVFEEIKEIRIEKFSLIEEYNSEMDDLNKLLSKLKRVFPSTKISSKSEKDVVKKVTKKIVKKKSINEPKDLSDFENELDMLEEKLNLMKR